MLILATILVLFCMVVAGSVLGLGMSYGLSYQMEIAGVFAGLAVLIYLFGLPRMGRNKLASKMWLVTILVFIPSVFAGCTA